VIKQKAKARISEAPPKLFVLNPKICGNCVFFTLEMCG
jgi:hypothetical protein